jgi:hypothetical protein
MVRASRVHGGRLSKWATVWQIQKIGDLGDLQADAIYTSIFTLLIYYTYLISAFISTRNTISHHISVRNDNLQDSHLLVKNIFWNFQPKDSAGDAFPPGDNASLQDIPSLSSYLCDKCEVSSIRISWWNISFHF